MSGDPHAYKDVYEQIAEYAARIYSLACVLDKPDKHEISDAATSVQNICQAALEKQTKEQPST